MKVNGGGVQGHDIDWTVQTLHEHFTVQLADLRTMLDERYATQTKAVDAALVAQQEAMQAARLADKEAVTKAETAGEKRFDLLNELRTGVATREQIDGLEKQINDLKSRLDKIEGHSGGLSTGWAILTGAVALVSLLVAPYFAIKHG